MSVAVRKVAVTIGCDAYSFVNGMCTRESPETIRARPAMSALPYMCPSTVTDPSNTAFPLTTTASAESTPAERAAPSEPCNELADDVGGVYQKFAIFTITWPDAPLDELIAIPMT